MKKLNKKGFTLVELLAVIAILAILMVIAIPGVLTLFNNAKDNAFRTELQSIVKAAKQQWMADNITSAGVKSYGNNGGDTCITLEIDKGDSFQYFVSVDKDGNVTTLEVTDGTNYYTTTGDNITPESLKEVEIATSGTITACPTE